jgi:beta-phosphoglucomutase-like phosphatase (HAD superfamily)
MATTERLMGRELAAVIFDVDAELLAELRAADIRLAIATTTSPENVTALVGSTLGRDACGWFDVIGAGDVVQSKKPDPAIYYWALERLGLAATRI